jgi:ribulose-phosphate 3-epimerase
MVKIAPSILSGDQGNLSHEASRLEMMGADWIHLDIMDAHFAPNLTFGPGTVKSIRKATRLTLDCHLMIFDPEKYVERFLEAGGDIITVHAEAVTPQTLGMIEDSVKKFGKRLGVAFKPATRLDALDISNANVSLVTVMTVNPGFSGQKLMHEVVPKVREAAEKFEGRGIEIEVDGGVDVTNARLLVEQGATVLVAGNSILGQPDPELAIAALRKSIGDGNK